MLVHLRLEDPWQSPPKTSGSLSVEKHRGVSFCFFVSDGGGFTEGFPKAYNIVTGWGINDLVRAKTVKLAWKPPK